MEPVPVEPLDLDDDEEIWDEDYDFNAPFNGNGENELRH